MTGAKPSARQVPAVHRFQSPCLRDLARWVDEKPHAPALIGAGQMAVSFEVLVARIAAVAEVLRTAGVKPGDVVAVAMPDGPDFLTGLLGAGEVAAAAPMDWRLTEAEFRARLTLLRARVLLTRSASDGLGAAVARTLGIPVFDLSSSEAPPQVSPHPTRVPEKCTLVLQTSATTGEPKLVPLTHINLHAMCVAVHNGLELRAEDRYLSAMPLHHILGFSSAVGQLMAGGSVACTGFDPLMFPAWLEELNPTWYAAGPALHRAILEIAQQDPEPFRRSALRFVRCGSGAGSPTLLNDLARVLQVNVINGYGLTEVGCATNTPPRLPRKSGSVGRTIGPEIAIMDASGNLLPPGAEGEVVMRGDNVMEGYLDAEEANREVFLHAWFHTGDLGHLDLEGDLFITGRIKEIINRGGETISPVEIDHALAEHPSIARAASFGVEHPTLGEDVVAAVVLRPGVKAAASEIRSFLSERLSRSKVPGRIWFVESIALSASGKPLRDALRTRFQTSARIDESPASSALEDESTTLLRQRVGAVWMQVLESDWPGAEDNFFAMGGDSLSATRLFALLGTEFQVPDLHLSDLHLNEAPLDIAAFLDSPTFFALVQVVSKRMHGANRAPEAEEIRFEDVSAVCLQSSGTGPPVFFFPAEQMEPWYLRHLVRNLGDQQPFFALRHCLTDPADFPAVAGRFATLISRIHPDGPMVLAGHCYGGILAYDVARRMLGMSRSGIAVVLIDVRTPGYPRVRVSSYVRYLPTALRAVLRGQAGTLAADLAGHFRFIRALRHRKSELNRESPAPKSAGTEGVQVADKPLPGGPTRRTVTPGRIVLGTYAPEPVPHLVANVIADDRQVSQRVLQDSRRGWRELARGPYQECSMSGSHNSVFDPENAPRLASFIRSSLQTLGTAVL